MSIIETSMEQLPYVAATAGYAAGFMADLYVQNRIAHTRMAVAEQLGEIGQNQSPGRMRRLGAAAISVSALAGAATGMFAGYAWQADPPLRVQPGVEIVVDASAATAVLDSGEPAKQVNSFAEAIANRDNVTNEALIARSGTVKIGTVDQLEQQTPFGDAVMVEATQTALDKSATQKDASANKDDTKSVGIVVLTNGNTIGVPENVVPRAKITNSPIYVVNVEKTAKNPENDATLKAIAEQSGGKYWAATDVSPDTMAETVSGELEAAAIKAQHNREPNWPKRVASALSLGLIGLAAHRRRREPVTLSGFGK